MSTSATSATTATPPAGFLGRLLTNDELKGFTGSPSSIETNIRVWLSGQQDPTLKPDEARLTRLGFIRGVQEQLSNGGTGGLSEVEQFPSPKAAKAELAGEIAEDRRGGGGAPYKTFAVPGIPGAVGFSYISGGQGGINIAFAKGRYYYLEGQEVGPGPSSVSGDMASLIAAAQHLYHRVSA